MFFLTMDYGGWWVVRGFHRSGDNAGESVGPPGQKRVCWFRSGAHCLVYKVPQNWHQARPTKVLNRPTIVLHTAQLDAWRGSLLQEYWDVAEKHRNILFLSVILLFLRITTHDFRQFGQSISYLKLRFYLSVILGGRFKQNKRFVGGHIQQ